MRGQTNLLTEIIVDNFAGGGGASTGIELATGRTVDIAINHDPEAIAMHKINHPFTKHYCESVWDINPREVCAGRSVALAWFSPDCKHFSKAKGGKPVEKKIRGLAWVAVKWAATVRPRVIILENVEEFKTWGPIVPERDKATGRIMKKVLRSESADEDVIYDTVVSEPGEIVPTELQLLYPDPKQKGRTFNSFVNALRANGYTVEWKELRACDYGAPTIRKRFFLIARCDGMPIVWPEPTHGPGKIPYRTAAEIIDWAIQCPSIFDRKKPLAENTMKRIARGLQKFVFDNPEPFIIQVNHGGDGFRGQDINDPLQTITAKHRYGIVAPYVSRIGQTKFGGDKMSYSTEKPLTTITSKAEHLLVAPYLTKFRAQSPGSAIDDPLHTITSGAGSKRLAGAAHAMGLIAPILTQYHKEKTESEVRGQKVNAPILTLDMSNRYALCSAFLAKHFGGNYAGAGSGADEPLHTVTAHDHNSVVAAFISRQFNTSTGHKMYEPLGTCTAVDKSRLVEAFLIKYYGQSAGQSLNDPLGTVTTRDRFGLISIHGEEYQIVDIGMRMLEPHELYAAQGFPFDYKIDFDLNGKKYSKSAQVARCGNSVPPPFAEALVRANLPEYCGKKFDSMEALHEEMAV